MYVLVSCSPVKDPLDPSCHNQVVAEEGITLLYGAAQIN